MTTNYLKVCIKLINYYYFHTPVVIMLLSSANSELLLKDTDVNSIIHRDVLH